MLNCIIVFIFIHNHHKHCIIKHFSAIWYVGVCAYIHHTTLCLSLPVNELLCSTAALPLFDWPLLNNTFVAVLVAAAVSVITGCCGNSGRWFNIDIHSSKQ